MSDSLLTSELHISQCAGTGKNLAVLIGEEDLAPIHQLVPELNLLSVSGFDWNVYLSPWPSPAVFHGGGAFAGRADELLTYLQQEVLPGQAAYSRRILAGYSLAGLFTLYALSKTDWFQAGASVSGSLWYPGFSDYLRSHPVHCRQVFLSLGDQEKNAKSAVLKTVEDKTREIKEILETQTETRLQMNPGGHFQQGSERIAWALQAFMK